MPHRPFLPDRPIDEARSAHIVAQGGVPLRAQRRMHELMSSVSATGRPLFTSTLSTSEMVVARATGLEPVSQVMGSSVFHVGYRGFSSWTGGELVPLTTAYGRAQSLALSRMQQEAAQLGANMVIDVRFLGRGYDWADDLIEFTAVGTAVRIQGHPPTPEPVLTLLTCDELYKLHRAGYWPVGIAIGNSFFYVRHADCTSEGSYFSRELPAHTDASQSARDLAVHRFRAFAAHFQAHGILGVKIERNARDHEYEANDRSHTAFSLDLLVMGTAVVRRGNPEPAPRPPIVVDLRDKKTRFGTHG